MHYLELSTVQITNLTMLMTIQDGIKTDEIAACCHFGLQRDQAQYIASLSFPHLLTIVVHLGNESLFFLRQDILNVLQQPMPLVGVMSAAQPLDAAPVNPHQQETKFSRAH
ncbi:MAG: hypothetical protein EKK45_03180 [Curvibacter sp.]|jgi:Flagellar transcriptional activator (FlhD)|nr:MAG: hypothetical protein EKK45_03180 [Curvibacter sp.]